MVRLRIGRFAWELYYTRTKSVVPGQQLRRRVSDFLGHFGYLTALGEYVMTDMVWLRVFASGGCGMICCYQLLQPKVQKISVFWQIVYVTVNAFQIYLLKRSQPELNHEELQLFNECQGVFTPRQVCSMVDLGEWRELPDGARLLGDGASGEVFFIVAGSCEQFVNGLPVGITGPGNIVCDTDVVRGASATATVTAQGKVRCLTIPVEAFQKLLDKDPDLREALQTIVARALVVRMSQSNQAAKNHQYRAMLEVVCTGDDDPRVAAQIAEYRYWHRISDEDHELMVSSLPRCSNYCTELLHVVPPTLDAVETADR